MSDLDRLEDLIIGLMVNIPYSEREVMYQIRDFDRELSLHQNNPIIKGESGIYNVTIEEYQNLQLYRDVLFSRFPRNARILVHSFLKSIIKIMMK